MGQTELGEIGFSRFLTTEFEAYGNGEFILNFHKNNMYSIIRDLKCVYEGKIDSIEQLKEILDGTNK